MTLLSRRAMLILPAVAVPKRKRRCKVGMQPDQSGVFFQLIIVGGGEFTYDATGNLRTANVGQTTTDPLQGITCYAGFSTFNGFGAVISLFSSTLDAQLWYADSGSSSQGALDASISSASGTDPFGNNFLAGVVGYLAGTGFVQMIGESLQYGSLNASSKIVGLGIIDLHDALTVSATPFIRITSPSTSGGAASILNLIGESADATVNSQINARSAQFLIASVAAVTSARLEVEGNSQTAIEAIPAAATDEVFATRLSADTNDRFFIDGNGGQQWGSGAAGADCGLNRQSANLLRVTSADFAVTALSRGLRVREGANCKQGTATLTAGTVVVANTSVTANSRIFLTAQDNNSTGALRVSARTAGASFTITSSNAADSGVVAFQIFEPG